MCEILIIVSTEMLLDIIYMFLLSLVWVNLFIK